MINIIKTTLLLMSILCSFFNLNPVSTSTFHIRPPFTGNFPMGAHFDHHYPNYSQYDNEVTIYDGDFSPTANPYFYRGHSGTDFEMVIGTQVLAAAGGTIYDVVDQDPHTGYGKRVYIDHQNGYFTLYGHLNLIGHPYGQQLSPGDYVNTGDVIGYSGNTGNSTFHLHFGVYFGPNPYNEQYSTDPFGWTGRYPDPLINYPSEGQGHQAECLWRSHSQDPLSCNDIIFEDGGSGFHVYPEPPEDPTWGTYDTGNAGRVTTTHNSTADNFAVWNLNDPGDVGRNKIESGTYEIFVYLPTVPDATHLAEYRFTDANNTLQIIYFNQSIGQNDWYSLGVYRLSKDSFVVLHTDTGEPLYPPKIVVADGIKFRSYRTLIPAVYK